MGIDGGQAETEPKRMTRTKKQREMGDSEREPSERERERRVNMTR